MYDKSQTIENLKMFISEQSGRDVSIIKETTSIEKDLGIYGDDAVELIISFGKKYNVDISNFMAAEYFSPEGDIILPSLLKFFFRKKKNKKELTIKNLLDAIELKVLNEDVITQSNLQIN